MSTSLRLEAGADKPTYQHPVAFSSLTLLVGHPASKKKLSDQVLAWLSV